MKKYIAPSLRVVNIENEGILAGSDQSSLGISKQSVSGSAALGNRRDSFCDEEE